MNQYGPAIVVGVLIGGAILFDDYVRPHPPMPPMMVEAIEMGELPFITEDIHEFHMAPDGDKESKIWIHKSADGDIAEKMQIAVIADDADIAEGVTMIKVKVDGTATADLGDKVKALVEQARKEGRKPSPEELKAIVTETLGTAGADAAVEVEVDVEELQ
jgi:hypothetical protein